MGLLENDTILTKDNMIMRKWKFALELLVIYFSSANLLRPTRSYLQFAFIIYFEEMATLLPQIIGWDPCRMHG